MDASDSVEGQQGRLVGHVIVNTQLFSDLVRCILVNGYKHTAKDKN